DERQHLDLLAHRNLLVGLRRPVEIAERRVAKRADRREPRGGELTLAGKRGQRRHHLVAFVEHERPRPLAAAVDCLRAHRWAFRQCETAWFAISPSTRAAAASAFVPASAICTTCAR